MSAASTPELPPYGGAGAPRGTGASALAAIAKGAPGLLSRASKDAVAEVEDGWARWLPLAGACVGASAAVTQAGLKWVGLIPAVAGLAAVFALSIATRWTTERGVAQFAGRGRASSATVAGVVATKFVLLLAISPAAWAAALLAAMVWSRAAVVLVARVGEIHPRAEDEDGLLLRRVDSTDVLLAIALSLPLVAWGKGLGVSSGIAAFVGALLAGVLVHRRQQGLDGAATAVVLVTGEIAVLAWFAAARPTALSPWVG